MSIGNCVVASRCDEALRGSPSLKHHQLFADQVSKKRYRRDGCYLKLFIDRVRKYFRKLPTSVAFHTDNISQVLMFVDYPQNLWVLKLSLNSHEWVMSVAFLSWDSNIYNKMHATLLEGFKQIAHKNLTIFLCSEFAYFLAAKYIYASLIKFGYVHSASKSQNKIRINMSIA